MPGLAKVIVVDPDARAGRQVQLGFEREGVPTQVLAVPVDPMRLELAASDTDDAGLLVVGGQADRALDLLRRVRALLDADHLDTPILFAGGGLERTDAERAGADEVVLQPAYLRDVVTIGRLLRNVASHQRSHITGSLAEMSGVLTLVRALSALGRSAVLTLIRGLRRGEVRFFEGEVTSAQVGLIHGQAALHQLLLWTDARFDFHYEDIVRRQQIPLEGEELWADAESFLAGVRDAAGQLSPSIVLEQDAMRVQSLGKQIPPEVHGVLRMFDGHRMLADVLEDSPYRVFETLRVTQRAVDAGLLRVTSQGKSKATWRAVLSIEEWLVGNEPPPATAPRPRSDSQSGGRARSDSQSGRTRTKRRANTPIAVPVNDKGIDWGQLVPRSVGAEVGPLAGVVPAAQRSGEISLRATREAPREKLESLMDTGARERIFSRDIGVEPSIVLDDPSGRVRRAASEATRALEEEEWERVEIEARRRVAESTPPETVPATKPPDVHSLPTEQLAPLAAPVVEQDVTEQSEKIELPSEPVAAATSQPVAKIDLESEPTAPRAARNTNPGDLVRQLVAEERAASELDVTTPRERVVLDEPQILVTPPAEPAAPLPESSSAPTSASISGPKKPMASVRPESQPMRAKAATTPPPIATPLTPPPSELRTKPPTVPPALPGLPEPRAKTPTAPPEPRASSPSSPPSLRAKPPTTPPAIPEIRAKTPTAPPAIAEARTKTPTAPPEIAEARTKTPTAPPPIPERAKTPTAPPAAVPEEPRAKTPTGPTRGKTPTAPPSERKSKRSPTNPPSERKRSPTNPPSERKRAPTNPPSERGRSKRNSKPHRAITSPPVVAETPRNDSALDNEITTLRPRVEAPVETAQHEEHPFLARPPLAPTLPIGVAKQPDSPVQAIDDEPSDGVVRPIEGESSSRPMPPPPKVEVLPDDRPAAKTGEISSPGRRKVETAPPPLASEEPSILVHDLSTIHDAVSAVATAQAAAAPTADAKSPVQEGLVSAVRKDATGAFTKAEEDFFREGHELEKQVHRAADGEGFDDLDEGYQPQGFWDRLRGGKKKKKP